MQALCSGESEFYAIVRGILNLLFIMYFLAFFRHEVEELEVLSDSSAGRGMASRLGLGKR